MYTGKGYFGYYQTLIWLSVTGLSSLSMFICHLLVPENHRLILFLGVASIFGAIFTLLSTVLHQLYIRGKFDKWLG